MTIKEDERLKPLKESLLRGRGVLSRPMLVAVGDKEFGRFGDEGRVLEREGFWGLNEIIGVV